MSLTWAIFHLAGFVIRNFIPYNVPLWNVHICHFESCNVHFHFAPDTGQYWEIYPAGMIIETVNWWQLKRLFTEACFKDVWDWALCSVFSSNVAVTLTNVMFTNVMFTCEMFTKAMFSHLMFTCEMLTYVMFINAMFSHLMFTCTLHHTVFISDSCFKSHL